MTRAFGDFRKDEAMESFAKGIDEISRNLKAAQDRIHRYLEETIVEGVAANGRVQRRMNGHLAGLFTGNGGPA